jgi:hypothetical protein
VSVEIGRLREQGQSGVSRSLILGVEECELALSQERTRGRRWSKKVSTARCARGGPLEA